MVPLRHVRVENVPLPAYLRRVGCSDADVSVLPSRGGEQDGPLFDLCVKKKKKKKEEEEEDEERIPVKACDIDQFRSFAFQLGVAGDRKPLEAIRSAGRWTLKQPRDQEAFVECELVRQSPYRFGNPSVFYYPLGWHQVLPTWVEEEVRRKGWRVSFPPSDPDCDGQALDPYLSDGFLRKLTHVPVECYSVGEKHAVLEKTVQVDLREFRNLGLFFRYQEQLFGSEDRACRNVLELFDAMLATKALWHVDPLEEVICLPCIRRKPELFYRVLQVERAGCKTPSYRTLTESDRFLEQVGNLFPASYAKQPVPVEMLKEETVKRMRASSIRLPSEQTAGIVTTKNWIHLVIPSAMCFWSGGSPGRAASCARESAKREVWRCYC